MKKSVEVKDPYLLVLTEGDVGEGEGKKTKRFIFDHGVVFNEYENQKIEKLKKQAQEVLTNKKYPAWLAKEVS
jgi:hypothetical protein